MEPLKQYCKTHNLTQKKFAQLVGMSEIHIESIIQGRRKPSLQLAKKIETVTEGEVTVQIIVDYIYSPASHIDRPASVMSEKDSREG